MHIDVEKYITFKKLHEFMYFYTCTMYFMLYFVNLSGLEKTADQCSGLYSHTTGATELDRSWYVILLLFQSYVFIIE